MQTKSGGALAHLTPPTLLLPPGHLQRGKRNREGMEGVIEKIRGSIYFAGKKGEDKKKPQLSELLVQIKS